MTFGILIKLINFRRLFIGINRVDLVWVLLKNVVILGVFMDGHHDLAVDIVVDVGWGQHDFKLRVVSDVQDYFGRDIRVVDNGDRKFLLITNCDTLEVNIMLFDIDVRYN